MSLSRLLDVTGNRLLLLLLLALLLVNPAVAAAQDPGIGFDENDPQFKLVWGIAFVCSIIALVQAYVFFKKIQRISCSVRASIVDNNYLIFIST